MRRAFGLIFAASGAAALIYEVTWTRLLTLQFGHGVAAASTVLAAFMGGLAIGAAIAGRVACHLDATRALRTYAALEIGIGLLAILLPLELDALTPLLAAAYADGNAGSTFAFLRIGAGLVLLSVPAAAMGATFPLASRWFVHHATSAAEEAGALYSANTVGAAIGALLAGFVLLPALGLTGTTWVGVLLNVAAAGGAWLVASRTVASSDSAVSATAPPARTRAPRAPRASSAPPTPGALRAPAQLWLAATALGLSGFASLTMQIVWTRLLAMILGPTTYAFSTMVGVFIAGIAIGAAIGSRLAARTRQPAAGLALCLTLSAAFAALAALFIDRGLVSLATFVAQPDITFTALLTRQALISAVLLAPMTITFGVAFPFAVALAARRDETVATDIGVVYAVNTAGAIAGSLFTGFLLISWLGLHGTIRLITVLSAIGGLVLVWIGRTSGRTRVLTSIVSVAVLVLGVWLPPWDKLLLSSGAYKYAASLRTPDLIMGLRAGELLYYKEGASGTVAVRKLTGSTSLAIDGKVDASNSGDMLTQRLLAHVPLLLHPNPKRVAIIGLGSGVTLGSALTHPIERADVLEISPEVVEASRFFADENHGALTDARTRLIVGDGRTHLLLTREPYDVIVSEPSNPWMAGIASLFTREFFEAAKARLSPGGVLCQWAHTYDISTEDLKSIVATFSTVFPDGTLWLVGDGDILLIGSNTPLDDRLASVAQAWQRPHARADLASIGALEPFHVLSMVVAEGEQMRAWADGATVQTDNFAELEFSGPRSIVGRARPDNAQLLRDLAARGPRPAAVAAAMQTASATAWRDRGWMLFRADAYRPAFEAFQQAVQRDPRDARALEGLLLAATPAGRSADARALFSRLASDATNVPAKLAYSKLLAAEGNYDQAAAIAFGVVQDDPSNVAALEQLASILSDVNDRERMVPVVARLRTLAPTAEATHYYSAALLFIEGRTDLALREAQAVLAQNPTHAKAHNLAGACLANLGQRDQARAAFQASLAADPKEPATYTNLGMLELESGNRERAAHYFAEALTIDPASQAARDGLDRTK